MPAFTAAASVNLTSTTSSQAVTVPVGAYSITVYNGGDNTVWMAWAATVAVPSTGVWTSNLFAVQPATTQSFSAPQGGGTLAYIAETAGGQLIIGLGAGE